VVIRGAFCWSENSKSLQVDIHLFLPSISLKLQVSCNVLYDSKHRQTKFHFVFNSTNVCDNMCPKNSSHVFHLNYMPYGVLLVFGHSNEKLGSTLEAQNVSNRHLYWKFITNIIWQSLKGVLLCVQV